MKQQGTRSRRLQSFCNGLLTPVIGVKGIDRQIELDLEQPSENSNLFYFALGHAMTVYPLIVGTGFGLFQVMITFHLY